MTTKQDDLFDLDEYDEEENEFNNVESGPQENEEDLNKNKLQAISSAVVTSTDWTTETILNQLKRGNIILNPKFQRRDAWTGKHKSKFIESLIMGLPIPQLVLAEQKNKRGTYIVIDGKQRLLSLRQFAANKDEENFDQLILRGLEIKTNLNGMYLQKMENEPSLYDDLTAFQNQTIRTVVVRNWPDEDFLYLLFLRLNTGSVRLSPQELRQALKPGPFTNFVEEYARINKGLRKILNIKKPDFRMRDVELLIRYYAFRNYISEYTGNLKAILDLTCEKYNNSWDQKMVEVMNQSEEFENAISVTYKLFGENAFRKWNGTKFESRFNRAVFDIMVFYFVDKDVANLAMKKSDEIVVGFKEMCDQNREFRASLETTFKSIKSTYIRLRVWGDVLNRNGIAVSVPRLENDRIFFG